MNKIRKGDEVIVIAGKDRGRQGTVIRIYDDGRVLVEGVNIARKHQKPNPNAGVPGGIIDKEAPLDISNVMLLTGGNQPVRVGYRHEERDGKLKKVRIAKQTDAAID